MLKLDFIISDLFSAEDRSWTGISGTIIYSTAGDCSEEEQENLLHLKEKLQQQSEIIQMKIMELDDVLIEEKIDRVIDQMNDNPSNRATLSCRSFLGKLYEFYIALVERNSIWKSLAGELILITSVEACSSQEVESLKLIKSRIDTHRQNVRNKLDKLKGTTPAPAQPGEGEGEHVVIFAFNGKAVAVQLARPLGTRGRRRRRP